MKIFQKNLKRFFILAVLGLTVCFSTAAVRAQSSLIDPSFSPLPSKDVEGGNFVLQPDGKILFFGSFQVVNGSLKNRIVRLNPDGSLDNTFNCNSCDFSIGSALVQPDGKIIVAGSIYSNQTQTSASRIKRLNPDGSLDPTFNSSFNPGTIQITSSGATVYAIQPDGKILVLIGTFQGGFVQYKLYRLNVDGSTDSTFTTIEFAPGRNLYEAVRKIFLLPDGKILAATYSGNGSGGNLKRYNSDGTRDTTFESPVLTGARPFSPGQFYSINDVGILPDGSLLIVGEFDSVNGISRVNIAKLLPAGNVDLNFNPANVFQNYEPIKQVEVYSNGKILVGTDVVRDALGSYGTTNRFIRFNADGSLDATFVSPPNLVLIKQFEIDNADSALVFGTFTENGIKTNRFARLNQNGAITSYLDLTYGIGASITALGIQPDGKILLAGDFFYINGVPRKTLARVNSDGSLDPTFNFGGISGSMITKIVVQTNGKILLAGSFTVNNTGALGIMRLNSDGSVDSAFMPLVSGVLDIAQQPDGKIIIGGNFNGINGQSGVGLARLNFDGTTDAAFNPLFPSNSTVIRSLLLQTDGKIMVGGFFTAVNGFARGNLVRLNADGSLDTSFNAGNIAAVYKIVRQPDGKYLISIGNKVIRINADGTTDETFQSPSANGTIVDIALQSDGSIVTAGNFTAPRPFIMRLKSNGSLDIAFLPLGANSQVRALIRQSDDKIVAGGDFTQIGQVDRLGIARINYAPPYNGTNAPLFDFDGDGRADLSVFRPSNYVWYQLLGQNNQFTVTAFGASGDVIAPADYDGDGRTDYAIFRPSTGTWWYAASSAGGEQRAVRFGMSGDIPLPSDFDGDGKVDYILYRPSDFTWYRFGTNAQNSTVQFGAPGDKPVSGDFDGDGKSDPAVFRPSTGTWWYAASSANGQQRAIRWGQDGDVPVAMDFDGDGVTDTAVFRPSNGVWYILNSSGAANTIVQFGTNEDKSVAADYDGDGRADIAVFRPSNGTWYILGSSRGFSAGSFGVGTDIPIPNAYIP